MAIGEGIAVDDAVVAAVSTREGGVSTPPYDSANMGLHVGDDPAAVIENRRRFCSAIGVDPAMLVCAEQVHGNRIARITESDRGRGAASVSDVLSGVDGMLTDVPGVPLAVFTADCVPLLLYDPAKKVAGIAHAGWRGTAAQIAQALVETLETEFGGDPESCRVALGPSAGPCCYEVGDDVVAAFRERGHPVEHILSAGTTRKPHLNLWEANARQFEQCGVPRRNIVMPERCTVCSSTYFSCRRDGPVTGRNMSVIMLK
jgi:YfiH family protein